MATSRPARLAPTVDAPGPVPGQVDARIGGDRGAVHADAAAGPTQLQGRQVAQIGSEAGGPDDVVE